MEHIIIALCLTVASAQRKEEDWKHWIPVLLPYNYATDDAVTSIIPGMAGEDYHIYAEVPESGFVCDGQVTMLTLRLNEKHSTFAQLMELQVWPSTASYVLMVHCSTKTTSSVTGGST